MSKPTLVLLALEDPHHLALFRQVLDPKSYTIAVAHERFVLNKILQEASPAAVILSEKLDGEKGIEIAIDLLERFPTLPILIFAESCLPEILKQSIRVGVSDCLIPPIKNEEILQTLENSMRRANRIGDWTRREVRRTTATLEHRVAELQKLETVLNHIEDGVMILDNEHRILLLNPIVKRAFGLVNEDYRNRPVLEIISHPDVINLLKMGSDNPLPFHEIAFDDGRVYSAQYTPIPGIGAAITLQDISYIKQVDRLKSEFVHTVSHDLRSPLTAVLGYTELLGRIGTLNPQQKEFVQRIQISVQNITALVNDLLDLGRIEAGFDIQKEVIPLDAIIQFTLEHLKPQADDKRQKIKFEQPNDVPKLRGNPIRLRQMLDNLIGNAIKYTPEGGNIAIQLQTQGDQVILRISDTGPGIPPADQPHIFDKFYRASNVPSGVGGSGLGLAIVKSIVDNHQGRIWVDSILGQGTTFTVIFPGVTETDLE